MGKTISISPVSRIEGQAKITIFLDDSDKISAIYFNVASFRGFEKFLEGAAIERLPVWHSHYSSKFKSNV